MEALKKRMHKTSQILLHKCGLVLQGIKEHMYYNGRGVNMLLETRRKCKMTAEMMEWEDEDKLAVMQFIPSEQYLLSRFLDVFSSAYIIHSA